MVRSLLLAALAAAALAGCSQGDTQTRYRVSGDVKFNGQPVPFGEVLFTPDGSKNNSGAQGIAEIKNGHYDTQGSRAPGIAGGPTIVRVTASSDDKGTLIGEHEYSVELPRADTTHNIDIPASAAKKKVTQREI